MSEINASSKKIADIIGVIDDIAFQTNSLALNAAVEAARAGEQGRGFAVVAPRFGISRPRSAAAAKEIKSLIQESVAKVDDGSTLVDASGKVLRDIVAGVKKVTDVVGEIAASSHEQSEGIELVNKAVMSMDEVTQQNAALVEQAAAAAQAMTEQSSKLTELMGRFRMGEAPADERPTGVPPATASSAAALAPEHRSSAPAKPAMPERRSASRPWARPGNKARPKTPQAAHAQAATTGGDSDWQQF